MIKCWFGFHNWEIFKEVPVDGNDEWLDYTIGGRDYHLRCTHCPVEEIRYGRGAWIAPKFERSADFVEGESYIDYRY